MRVTYQSIEIERLGMQSLAAAQSKQLAGELSHPLRSPLYLLEIFHLAGSQVGSAEKMLRESKHYCHLIIGLMRDPSGQTSYGLDSLCPLELAAGVVQLGHVQVRADCAAHFSCLAKQRGCASIDMS